MGLTKTLMDDQETLRNIAESLLTETGYLSTCEVHDETISNDDADALEKAYRLANSRISQGKIKLPAGYTSRDLTDVMKQISTETLSECEQCSRMR